MDYCRVLEYKSIVWASLQQAIGQAGFIVANVAILDKKQGGYNANAYAGAVKQELAISAYKPDEDLEDRFKLELELKMEFGIRPYPLKQLPLFIFKGNQ